MPLDQDGKAYIDTSFVDPIGKLIDRRIYLPEPVEGQDRWLINNTVTVDIEGNLIEGTL